MSDDGESSVVSANRAMSIGRGSHAEELPDDIRQEVRGEMISGYAAFARALTNAVLIIALVWGITLIQDESPVSDLPFFRVNDENLNDMQRSKMRFFVFLTVLSWCLLAPYLTETAMVAYGLLRSDQTGTKHWEEVDRDPGSRPRSHLMSHPFFLVRFIFCLVFSLCTIPMSGWFVVKAFAMLVTGQFRRFYGYVKLTAVVLFDNLLMLLLFAFSTFLIGSSESITAAVVNLVAVQVFADLDDQIVGKIMRPTKSITNAWKQYFPKNPRQTPEESFCEIFSMAVGRTFNSCSREVQGRARAARMAEKRIARMSAMPDEIAAAASPDASDEV